MKKPSEWIEEYIPLIAEENFSSLKTWKRRQVLVFSSLLDYLDRLQELNPDLKWPE